MPRQSRIVIPGLPHHVTQRGNRRMPTFFDAADYRAYLDIAAEEFAAAEVEVWAYCLMPNHVHLIATPTSGEGLAVAVGATHRRYTYRVNRRQGWSGYLWQGRFASSVMDEEYLRLCAKYVGLNPVRAGLVASAVEWPWSSVAAHLTGRADDLLTPGPIGQRIGDDPDFFDEDAGPRMLRRIRDAVKSGAALGSPEWLSRMRGGDTHACEGVACPVRSCRSEHVPAG